MILTNPVDVMAALMAHLSSFQSAHLAPGVCVEVWVAVRAKALAWVTESASATLATRDSCARAAPTATSERKAPTTASAPVQVAADHKSGADFPSVSSQNQPLSLLLLLRLLVPPLPCSVLPLVQEVRRSAGLQMPRLQSRLDAPRQQVCR